MQTRRRIAWPSPAGAHSPIAGAPVTWGDAINRVSHLQAIRSHGRPADLPAQARPAYPSAGAWWQVLAAALLLYALGLAGLAATRNLNLFPAVVILGSCTVPVTYAAFFYQHKHRSALTLSTTSLGFFLGATLAIYVTALLEHQVFTGPELLRNAQASVIEEGAKLLCVLLAARRLRHDSEVDGIILGAAVGMGFAALENTGYCFTSFLLSQGSVAMTGWVTRQTGGIILTPALTMMLLRGVLSPMTHGTWTAIVAGILFGESVRGRFRLTGKVILACLLALALHCLWNSLPDVVPLFLPSRLGLLAAEATTGAIGLLILARRWRAAIRVQAGRAGTDGGSRGQELESPG
jgi:protease PrsW